MRRVSRVFVFLLLATVWATARGSAAGTAELLRDVNQSPSPGFSGVLGRLQPAGDGVVFTAALASNGNELWGSDGSGQGTELLREILPGPDSPRIWMLGTVRGSAVFLADDQAFESFGLWRSDGTRQGTVQIDPGLTFCLDGPQSALLEGHLYFVARRGDDGCRLWRTNAETVQPVEEPTSSVITGVRELTPAGNRLFYLDGSELWVTAGTVASTRLLGVFASLDGPRELTAVGTRLFFIAPGAGGEDEELWVSDGTAAGTRQVSRFFEPQPFKDFGKSLLEGFNGVLYFVADDGTGLDLWRSDGTTAGTRRVTDFIAANPFIDNFDETHLVQLRGRLLFPARDQVGDSWLWESGGTPATTKQVSGCPGGCPWRILGGPLLQDSQRAVFTTYGERGTTELWVTDGTGAGTRRLDSLCSGYCGDSPRTYFLLLDQIFYIKLDGQGHGLWRTDGTRAGTIRLTAPGLQPHDFETPFDPVVVGDRIFFTADPGGRGSQLWTSDGTPEGTGLVTLIDSLSGGSSPTEITPFLGGVIFGAVAEGEVGFWRSDGTTAGTQPIRASLWSTTAGFDSPRPVVSGGLAFFLKRVPFGHDALWRTDGTEAGTFRVTPEDIRTPAMVTPFGGGVIFLVHDDVAAATILWASDGTVAGTRPLFPMPSSPPALWATDSRIYFVAYDEQSLEQLWISDGTAAGTHPITDFDQSVGGAFFQGVELEEVGGTIFFTANGRLWKSAGTVAGTVAVLPDVAEGRVPSDLTAFQGALYFLAYTEQGEHDRGLWRSDGTAAGTFLVRPVGPPADASSGQPSPGWLTVVGDRLYFVASDGEHGSELWKSDGTADGTVMVRDIFPGGGPGGGAGEGSSDPSELTAAPGRLFFVANDGASGRELWESDGTSAGTRRVQDILAGAGGSNPHDLTVSGSRLFFAANDGTHGEEPWVLPLTGSGCTPAPDALCLGGRFRVEANWRDFQGNQGTGTAVALTADTGYFWFFEAANVEVILKVLDGRGLNDHHWVFYGALSSVEYVLTVTDTQTGAVRRYVNPPGRLGSVADTEAFGPRGANLANPLTFGPTPRMTGTAAEALVRAETAPATGSCAPSATRLCLNDGRFAVEARWKDFAGNTGTGKAVVLAGGDTGYFWFFDDDNVEVVLKVLDGRPLNGKYWVFYGALSSVEYTLTVTDTVTGTVKTYTNPSGHLASVADTGAF